MTKSKKKPPIPKPPSFAYASASAAATASAFAAASSAFSLSAPPLPSCTAAFIPTASPATTIASLPLSSSPVNVPLEAEPSLQGSPLTPISLHEHISAVLSSVQDTTARLHLARSFASAGVGSISLEDFGSVQVTSIPSSPSSQASHSAPASSSSGLLQTSPMLSPLHSSPASIVACGDDLPEQGSPVFSQPSFLAPLQDATFQGFPSLNSPAITFPGPLSAPAFPHSSAPCYSDPTTSTSNSSPVTPPPSIQNSLPTPRTHRPPPRPPTPPTPTTSPAT